MQSIMVMSTKGDNMGILKKIWHWLSQDVTKGFQKSDEEFMLKSTTYNTGGYTGDVDYIEGTKIRREGTKVKGGVNTRPTTPRPNFTPPSQNPSRDFKREADEYFRQQQQARRDSDDNFLMGAMVGYVIADSLNDSPSARDIEVTKSSSYESSHTPSSSSSYDSGSYSSSYDSGSSSSSCDSGGC